MTRDGEKKNETLLSKKGKLHARGGGSKKKIKELNRQ